MFTNEYLCENFSLMEKLTNQFRIPCRASSDTAALKPPTQALYLKRVCT